MNKWKIMAIIFIVISVLEFGILCWAWNTGTEMMKDEMECVYNICEEGQSYYYDDLESMCYCYENHEIVKQVYLK